MRTPEEIAAAEQRVAEAKSKYRFHWWYSKDPVELFWGQLNEPILLVPFDQFHAASEEAMGRPVWTHEFADMESLRNEFQNKIPKATFEAVLAKIPAEKTILVTV